MCALAAWVVVGVMGINRVDLSAKVLGIVVAAEFLVVIVYDVLALGTAPEGITADGLVPDQLFASGVGAALAFHLAGQYCWMYAIGVLTLTPYDYWRRTHAIHHATSGNLDRRGLGVIEMLVQLNRNESNRTFTPNSTAVPVADLNSLRRSPVVAVLDRFRVAEAIGTPVRVLAPGVEGEQDRLSGPVLELDLRLIVRRVAVAAPDECHAQKERGTGEPQTTGNAEHLAHLR